MRAADLNSEIASTGLATQPIGQFLAGVEPLTAADRRTIVEQALLLMEETYVHLPLKRAMHAVDPVQRLRLLRHRIDLVSERSFHEEMISTFMSVRDLHTNYILPAPYNRATAFLPFQVLELFKDDVPIYIALAPQGFQHATFKSGVRVTHMNGVPIARAVELNARRNAGSNAEASHAHGLERLTFRPLMMSLPPDEEWADLRYLASDGTAQEIRFPWSVALQPGPEMAMSPAFGEADPAQKWMFAQGVDVQRQAVNDVKKHLFAREQLKIEAEVLAFLRKESGFESAGGPDFNVVSRMPDYFTFGTKKTAHGDRGYIRIASFNVRNYHPFVQEFIRILKLLPQDGLIVDVRGNGGGNIYAGEMLLQTMSAIPVEPERFHFINTPRMLELVKGLPDDFGKWARSMSQAVLTGATYSQGLPFEDASEYNKIGRQYTGKVALLTDAFCYSTTDIFAAGFQDHGIGPIIGNHACTGAGGANVFTWDIMKECFDAFSQSHPIAALPKGGGMRVAVRRATRVRDYAGEPLEDLGVVPDRLHRPTLDDLIEGDRNLLDVAGELTRA